MIEKFTTKVSINTKGEAIRFAKECEQIADEYAIDFLHWSFGYENEKDYYIKALKEFKKEKGL